MNRILYLHNQNSQNTDINIEPKSLKSFNVISTSHQRHHMY